MWTFDRIFLINNGYSHSCFKRIMAHLRNLPKLLFLSLFLLFILTTTGVHASVEVINELIKLSIGYQCAGYAAGVQVDVDNNGVDDTQVVFTTLTGEAYPDLGYFFSFIDSHCGGSYPYTGKGRLKVHFVDMLASGFVWNDSSSWTYTRMSSVEVITSHDYCTNGASSPYLGVQAYRDLGQTNAISGSQSGTNFVTPKVGDFGF